MSAIILDTTPGLLSNPLVPCYFLYLKLLWTRNSGVLKLVPGSYGWEFLTCELGLLALFLYENPVTYLWKGVIGKILSGWYQRVLSGRRREEDAEQSDSSSSSDNLERRQDESSPPNDTPPNDTLIDTGGDDVERKIASAIVLFLFRYAAFRILVGGGASKLGVYASECWTRSVDCTTTHFVTQPLPAPLAYYVHNFMPLWGHQLLTVATLVEQLALPFFIFSPNRNIRRLVGVLELAFQV